MKNLSHYKILSLVLILAYVLSACSGVPAGAGGPSTQNNQSQEVVFSGTVEAMDGGAWIVSGQTIALTSETSVDASIQVGDNVKVEAVVDQAGAVTAVRIESAGADDEANANDDNTNEGNANDANANNTNDIASNSNDGPVDNSNSDTSNANANENDNDNGNDNTAAGNEQEVFGTVQAITTESITINGIVYLISDFTEFKDLIAVGDAVKVHVRVNADGTFTIREIERAEGAGDDDNANSNDSDDNGNSNDDDGNDNGSGGNNNGDDDNGNDDVNENDDDSNENGDDDNDSGSNNG